MNKQTVYLDGYLNMINSNAMKAVEQLIGEIDAIFSSLDKRISKLEAMLIDDI
jgi:hypothetical protein